MKLRRDAKKGLRPGPGSGPARGINVPSPKILRPATPSPAALIANNYIGLPFAAFFFLSKGFFRPAKAGCLPIP